MNRQHFWRKFLSIGLSVLVFISTMGIPMHAMYCICLNERVVGVFTEVNTSCSNHQEVASSDATVNSCCKPTVTCCSSEDDDSCMHREFSISKIDINLMTGQVLEADETVRHFYNAAPLLFSGLKVQASSVFLPYFPHGPPGPMTPFEGLSAYIAYGQVRC